MQCKSISLNELYFAQDKSPSKYVNFSMGDLVYNGCLLKSNALSKWISRNNTSIEISKSKAGYTLSRVNGRAERRMLKMIH